MEPVGRRQTLIKLGRVLGEQPGHVQQGPGGRHRGQLLDVDQEVQELDAEELMQVARVLGGEGPGQGLVLEPQHPDHVPYGLADLRQNRLYCVHVYSTASPPWRCTWWRAGP